MEAPDIKQILLAEVTGKRCCILNSYVCNHIQPSIEVLFDTAKHLKVDPDELSTSSNLLVEVDNC